MAKVSIALRGWRFDQDDVMDESGSLRPLSEMSEDARNRIVRLSAVLGEPCDACWLIHGEEDLAKAHPVQIVYGEPLAEVMLCDDHEADFLYWFREAGGDAYAGTGEFAEQFHEWFADGGRAPEGYAGLEHVQEEPDALPDVGEETCSIPQVEEELDEMDEAEAEALDLDLDALDV